MLPVFRNYTEFILKYFLQKTNFALFRTDLVHYAANIQVDNTCMQRESADLQVCTGLQNFRTPPPARHTHKVKHLSKLVYIDLNVQMPLVMPYQSLAIETCLVTFYFLTKQQSNSENLQSTKIWLKKIFRNHSQTLVNSSTR